MQPVVTTPINGPPISFPTGPGIGKKNGSKLICVLFFLNIICECVNSHLLKSKIYKFAILLFYYFLFIIYISDVIYFNDILFPTDSTGSKYIPSIFRLKGISF